MVRFIYPNKLLQTIGWQLQYIIGNNVRNGWITVDKFFEISLINNSAVRLIGLMKRCDIYLHG
jgi:hypothetical protein